MEGGAVDNSALVVVAEKVVVGVVVVVVVVLVVSSSCCCISCSGCGSGWGTLALVPPVCDGRCSDEGGRVLDGEVQGEHGAARGKHRDILGLEGEVCSGGALGPGEEEELLEEKELLEELLELGSQRRSGSSARASLCMVTARPQLMQSTELRQKHHQIKYQFAISFIFLGRMSCKETCLFRPT